MIHQKYEDVVTNELLKGHLPHDVYEGFLFDYRVLHCLLRKYNPKTVFEIGCNIGSGVNVIAAAVPDAKIYSLDLPYNEMMQDSKQYPIGENGEDRVGSAATVPFTLLRGDSLTFDYSPYQIDAAFIDGEHDTEHAYTEALKMLAKNIELIIFHDADMSPVITGIIMAYMFVRPERDYYLFRVMGTRIAYLLRSDIAINENSHSHSNL
jgi:hypothetical protein